MTDRAIHLQLTEGGLDVVNLHPFGQDLQAFCDTDEAVETLPNVGFMDGGCYALAQALQNYLRRHGVPCRLCTVGRKTNTDHVVVEVMVDQVAVYLDRDGMATAEEIIRKMEEEIIISGMRFEKSLVIEPLNHAVARANGLNDYSDCGVPAALERLLERELGAVDMERFSMEWLEDVASAPGGY